MNENDKVGSAELAQMDLTNPYMQASENVDVSFTVVQPPAGTQYVGNGFGLGTQYGMQSDLSASMKEQDMTPPGQFAPIPPQGPYAPVSQMPGNSQYAYMSDQNGNYQANGGTYNNIPILDDELTVGQWVLTIFLSMLPIAGLVMLFVWGFGKGNKARANYAKAMLIWMAIAIGVSIIGSLLLTYACFSTIGSWF